MQRLVILVGLAAGLLGPSAVLAAEQTVKLAVSNMYCAACPLTVRKALTAVPGVIKAEVSYKDKSALVTFDDQKASVQALITAVSNAGYPTQLAASGAPKTQ
jgi:periplasmic mercuric ion binding protein